NGRERHKQNRYCAGKLRCLVRIASVKSGSLLKIADTERRRGQVNYGHSRDTQYFTNAGVESFVHTGVHEVTDAYVLNLPWHITRLHPFALVGTGIVQFNPFTSGTSVSGAQSQTKPAVLWGAGVNYDLSRHSSLRLQYRGLFCAGPDFRVASLKTHKWQPMAEPSFGIVIAFSDGPGVTYQGEKELAGLLGHGHVRRVLEPDEVFFRRSYRFEPCGSDF